MKTKKILALWAFGMLAILTIFCYGQGHTIRQFPTTNQLANADAFVVELGTGTTNMNVTKANMPGALGVPTLAQMLAATNDSFAYAFSLSNRVVTSAGTANVSNNLTASNLWDRSNVKWWGAKGDRTTDDTSAVTNAVNWAQSFGGSLYFPAGVYRVTKPIVLTNACSIRGDNPGFQFVQDQEADFLFGMRPGTGTWLDFSGTNGFTGNNVRGLHFDNFGVTNFYKAFYFGQTNIEGACYSTFRNITCFGNPTLNMSDCAWENWNAMFNQMWNCNAAWVNTGLRLIACHHWKSPGNSVIEALFVEPYAKSSANGNTNTAAIELLHYPGSTNSVPPGTPGECYVTFVRPQVNMFNGSGEGMGVLIKGFDATNYVSSVSMRDLDVEGVTNGAIVLERVNCSYFNIIGNATAGAIYLDANCGGNVIVNESGLMPAYNSGAGNLFFGTFNSSISTGLWGFVSDLGSNATYVVKADRVFARNIADPQVVAYGYSKAVPQGGDGYGTIAIGNVGANQGRLDYSATAPTALTIENSQNNDAGHIVFRTKTAGTPTTNLVLLGSGFAGFRTNNPQAALHVGNAGSAIIEGTLTVGTATNNAAGLFLYGGTSVGTPDPNAGQIYLGDQASQRASIAYDHSSADLYIDNTYNDDVADIFFRTKTAGTPITALTISGSGRVGIGTNAPQASLHVVGNNTTSNILTLGVTNADLKARVDTNGNVFANKYYGDGSTLTGIGAASTNVAMISAGWVEAGGGHFTNDLSVDGTMRVNTLNVGTLVVTSCPAFTVGNLNVVTNANVATLTASNNATFLAGATFVTAVTSSADSASNAPAANEFPNASWVRGLFNNGAILYAGPGVRTDATNDSSGQFMYLFTNTIPATSSRKYAIPNAGDYVGGVMTSNALTFVQGPIYVHAFLQSSNGNGGQSISVHPEIYYSYDRTNWQGDFSANDQVIATGTNLYEWVISFPAITSTNSIGFWIERRFKVGAATGATHPDLYFHLGTNFASGINDASHISFSGPSSGTGNAYLANDQTFTGSNTFNGAINAASNINANRITATNRLTIGPTGTGTTFSNNAGILTIRDVAGQTVGVIDNDATLGTAFWIISTPTSNSMAAAITADTNKAAMAIGGGHVTNKVTIDGNLEFTTGLLAGDANVTNYTLIAGTNDVYIGKSNVNIVAIMGGVAGKATPMSIVITNGTGVSWGISFSAVTNAWHWPYSQGAPTVMTNATQLLINLRLDGSNVLAAWAAYAWP